MPVVSTAAEEALALLAARAGVFDGLSGGLVECFAGIPDLSRTGFDGDHQARRI